jgi:hypothetical protein
VTVTLSAGGRRVLARDVDPRHRIAGPYLAAGEQTLVLDQNHEPGEVLARARVLFKRARGSECQVPHTALELTSRSHSVG